MKAGAGGRRILRSGATICGADQAVHRAVGGADEERRNSFATFEPFSESLTF